MAELISTMTVGERDLAIDELSDLAILCSDAIHGYEECADIVQDNEPELADYFKESASSRRNLREELLVMLTMLDHEQDVDELKKGTLGGILHQAFVKFRTLFESGEETALAEIERGEKHLIERYEEALGADMPDDVLVMLRRQHAAITRHEQKVEDLRKAS